MQGLNRQQNRIRSLESKEREILDMLQFTQKREQEAFVTLQEAISGSIGSHKQRLETKHSRNNQIREDYFKAPSFDHLKPAIQQLEEESKSLMQYRSAVQLQPLKAPTGRSQIKASLSLAGLPEPGGSKFKHVTVHRGGAKRIPQKSIAMTSMESLEEVEVPIPDPQAEVISCKALPEEYEHVTFDHQGNFEFQEA